MKKPSAFNGEYIRALPLEEFVRVCRRWLEAPYATWASDAFDEGAWRAVAELAQTRIAVLSEITQYVDFLFLDAPEEDQASWTKAMKPGAEEILASTRARWAQSEWTAAALKAGPDRSQACDQPGPDRFNQQPPREDSPRSNGTFLGAS